MTAANGLVVMAYGTPGSLDEVAAYYTHIRHGRPPSAEQLADLTARYEAIGGVSPLAERTRAQVAAIHAALEAAEPGRWAVTIGNKHVHPFVEDAVAELAAEGVRQVVGLVLAPHYSRASVGEYHRRAGAVAAEAGVTYLPIDSWHDEPAWLDAQATRVRDALATLPPPNLRTSGPVLDENARRFAGSPNLRTSGPVLEESARRFTAPPSRGGPGRQPDDDVSRPSAPAGGAGPGRQPDDDTSAPSAPAGGAGPGQQPDDDTSAPSAPPNRPDVLVVFTAHSLPERVLEGDPYADQLAASAAAIAARAGLGDSGDSGGDDGGDSGSHGGGDEDRTGWRLGWQSAGRTPEPWRGPDIAQVIAELGTDGRTHAVAVCPQGFVSDHLEVLYDLDIDARRRAEEAGLAFARTASINDDPAVMSALASRIRRTMSAATTSPGPTTSGDRNGC